MISSPLVAPRLVGRDDECAFLMRRLDAVLAQGTASLTFVEGDAGMGKTRLLGELRRRAHELHALVLDAHALEHVREPYAPFVLGIARALESAPATVAEDLRAVADALDPDVAMQKAKRLRAVATALRRIMRAHALAIFVEDVHWADRASLDLLAFFTVELASSPLFVVATQRPDEARAELPDALRTAAHTVRLGPLAERDVGALLREALRGQATSIGADRLRGIAQLAGGNPLFALELLRNALAGAPDDVAPAIAYPIVRRWESLDRGAREILAAAAAAGEIDRALLARIAERSEDEIEDALERARRLHLVERERGSDRWRFQHALTRAAIEARIPPRSRPAIHRRIGELLEARAGPPEPARLAYHWAFADDPERASRYNETAGDRAVALHDYATATRFYETALRSAPAELARLARLNEKLASATLIEAAPRRAEQPLAIALDAYRELGDGLGIARIEMLRSRAAWFDGEARESLAAAQRALAAAEPFGPSAQLFDVWVRLAQIHQLDGRTAEARRAVDAAEAMRAFATPDATIRFCTARAMLRASAWDLPGFTADYDEAVAVAERIGHVELLVSTQNNRALNAFLTGRRDVAIPALESSIATSYEYGLRWHVPNALLSLARVRHVFGDVRGARQAMIDALSSSNEARRLDVWIAAYGVPIALAAQDDALLARCTVVDPEAIFAAGSVSETAHIACAYAELALARGDAAGAAGLLARALATIPDDARPLHLCGYVAQWGREDNLERARALLEADSRDRSRAAERALFDACIAARRRRRGEAAQRAQEAAEIYGELHWVLQQARALEIAGRDADALRIYRAAGSARDAARLAESSRSADPLAPLTPREREIAELVLAGRSNREAGTILGLSERTVGNHLQSVFNRLGIGSRRELSAYVASAASE
ncbi:MAG TPA: AAA family ATPase [Candidatus Limnocylindrales bacterium]|nr:AAA family ATPase [Candidatus Limnocylindrales bacterium]